jgi:hypothetical protein
LDVEAGLRGFEACKCANADETGASDGFRSVRNESPHTSKNANLSNNRAGLHTCTDRKAGNGGAHESDQENTPPRPASPSGVEAMSVVGRTGAPAAPAGPAPVIDPWKDLDIPGFLDRRRPSQGEEAPASEAMPADRGQPTPAARHDPTACTLDIPISAATAPQPLSRRGGGRFEAAADNLPVARTTADKKRGRV